MRPKQEAGRLTRPALGRSAQHQGQTGRRDRRFALPPFDAAAARGLIDGLKARPLLDGKRGMRAADIDAAAEALARFSVMAADLAGLVQEIDVNPMLCGPQGCVALDALVVGRPHGAAPATTT